MLQLLLLLAVIIVVFKLVFEKKQDSKPTHKPIELSDFNPIQSISGTENLDLYETEVKYFSNGEHITSNLLDFMDRLVCTTAGGANSVLKTLKKDPDFYQSYLRGQDEEFLHAFIVNAFGNRLHALNISPEDQLFKDLITEYPKILNEFEGIDNSRIIKKDLGLLATAVDLHNKKSYAEALKYMLESYIGTSTINQFKSETHQLVNEISEADLKWFDKDQLEITGKTLSTEVS